LDLQKKTAEKAMDNARRIGAVRQKKTIDGNNSSSEDKPQRI
jgi:hypothetical protein